jgi:hypothetical protein
VPVRSAQTQEPALVVRRRARPFFLRARFIWSFGPVALVALLGLGVLLPTGNLLVPFEPR